MASVNPLSRELVFKIVYYGPGLGGKTTTLEHIHATAKPDHRGKLVSLATPVDRTLYFDFLPMRLPPIRGMHVRLQLFTVPGQVYFNATRKLVLTGADGVVFVADSQMARADANLESLDNLRDNLADQGRNLNDVPIVFQYNKYDLPDVLSVDELDKLLNRWQAPSLATSARTGLGVYEGLERITHAVLGSFETQMPESVRVAAAASYDPNEEGLAAALRGASQVEDRSPTSGAIFSRVSSSRSTLGSIPPDTGHDEPAPPPIDKAAMRAASLPVTTFPEVPDDGWGTKEKPSISPAPDAPISGRGESRLRGSDLRTSETRSRNRPSVLPPKPYAPLIPHAAPPRAPAGHAPAPPANATTSTTKDATQGHAPAPPPNATTSAATKPATTTVVSHAPAPPPNASTAATTASDKAPTTEKTIAGPVRAPTTTLPRVESVPAKPEVAAPKAEPVPVRIEIAPKKPEPVAVNIDPAPPNLGPAQKKPEPSAVKPEPAPLKLDVAPAKPEPPAPKPEPTPVKVEPVQAK
ncbi:MAG TPA: ADP-ribosylation factor-like protein, partial [Polyangium sp.]|nr:ADP-ribosylation factor-like protein [Polyangium sp.]